MYSIREYHAWMSEHARRNISEHVHTPSLSLSPARKPWPSRLPRSPPVRAARSQHVAALLSLPCSFISASPEAQHAAALLSLPCSFYTASAEANAQQSAISDNVIAIYIQPHPPSDELFLNPPPSSLLTRPHFSLQLRCRRWQVALHLRIYDIRSWRAALLAPHPFARTGVGR